MKRSKNKLTEIDPKLKWSWKCPYCQHHVKMIKRKKKLFSDEYKYEYFCPHCEAKWWD